MRAFSFFCGQSKRYALRSLRVVGSAVTIRGSKIQTLFRAALMNQDNSTAATSQDLALQLREIGEQFYERGWSRGTSSNYSAVVGRDPLQILITASGKDKGNLGPNDFVLIDENAKPVVEGQPKSSAETWLHVVAAGCDPQIGAVLHTHSVWGTLLSDVHGDAGGFWIEGFEMLKGLEGVRTHEHRQWVPIYENTQDIASLAEQIKPQFNSPDQPPFHGFLMRKHGLYTWGKDLFAARRHIEIFEFLFECLGRQTMMGS